MHYAEIIINDLFDFIYISTMASTAEQDAFVLMAHFCNGIRNADGIWLLLPTVLF